MKGNALVQQAESVSHGAVRRSRNITQSLFLHLLSFLFHQLPHPVRDGFDGNPLEIIPLASGQNGDGNLVHLRGRQNENHIGRRLLQGFQQRIKGSYGEHMHLVDDVNLIFPLRRRVGYLIHNFPDVVHAVIGGRIDLDHVHAGTSRNGAAASALPTGRAVHRMLTVDGFRKNFRYGCLSGSSCSAEQIGMSDSFGSYLIFQSRNNVVLSLYVLKTFRAKFTVKSCIRHIHSRFCDTSGSTARRRVMISVLNHQN